MRALVMIAAAVTLSGCVRTVEKPIIRDQIVEVKVPVAVGCPGEGGKPKRPARLSDEYPTMPVGKDPLETANIQLALVSAKVLDWIGYGDEADGVMTACSLKR